jgi:hypothetical protein
MRLFLNGKGSTSMVSTLLISFPTSCFMDWRCSALVEQVKDGSTVRVRLLMPDGEHQFVNLSLAGVRSPRVSAKPGETSEPWGDEVRI